MKSARDDLCRCPDMVAYHDSEGRNIIAPIDNSFLCTRKISIR